MAQMGNKFKIAFYCNGGSPTSITPNTYWGLDGQPGTGGAETALIWLSHHLARRGHDVSVYNGANGDFDGVKYRPLGAFDLSDPIDVFVLFRNPWSGVTKVNAKTTVFWSCDQQTEGNYATEVFPWVDHTICISPYHLRYHVERYGLNPNTAWVTDLGVNWDEYKAQVPKVPNRLIYCSQPERGLTVLFVAFGLIREQVPDVSLTITADRRLWGVDYTGDELYHKLWDTMGESDRINYVGAVPREELAKLQLEAEVMSFPCTYEELHCLAATECQVAGAVPVTSMMGSLPTTVDVGVTIDESPNSEAFVERFAGEIIDLLKNRPRLEAMQKEARKQGIKRFKWEVIAEAWEKKLVEWINDIRL